MTGPAALAIPRARCSPQEQHGRRYAKYKGGRKYDRPQGHRRSAQIRIGLDFL